MKYVYKIISAVSSLAVLPAIVFSPIIYYYFSSVALQGAFALVELFNKGSMQEYLDKYNLDSVPTGISDTMSLYDLFDLVMQFSGMGDSGEILSKIEIMIPSLIATAAAFILTVVCAIVTAVLAIACKDNRKVIASSFAGIGMSLLTVMLIENTVSPLVSGAISMTDFIDAFWASLIAQVEEISVAPMFYMIPALFGFVALWTILYNATLPEKEKAERMKMIG
jgi:hypothetical protein